MNKRHLARPGIGVQAGHPSEMMQNLNRVHDHMTPFTQWQAQGPLTHQVKPYHFFILNSVVEYQLDARWR
ncbi:MAG: hypothetical protein HQL86_05945 [Magnetococcales bacterium]|nr:hypothetical protein [Magnetococcales bacterium]